MIKRNLLLTSLLLVLGLGIMAPSASAQVEGNGTVFNVSPSLYTLRPNSIGDAGGQIYMTMASGLGTIAGGETFTVTFSKPIVGAAGISLLPTATAAAEFCNDSRQRALSERRGATRAACSGGRGPKITTSGPCTPAAARFSMRSKPVSN